MTISTEQLSTIVSHFTKHSEDTDMLFDLLETTRSGDDCGQATVENYGSLGEGIYLLDFGSYVFTQDDDVIFLKYI